MVHWYSIAWTRNDYTDTSQAVAFEEHQGQLDKVIEIFNAVGGLEK